MRTPRNYHGIFSPIKRISDLLPEVVGEIGQKMSDPREEIFKFWFELIGEKMGPLTEPVSFEDGVLTVKVKSSTLYGLLCQHEKPRLLQRLKEKFSIRNIIFRVG
ncbi:MAG TPA: DUF721 domain-containing protein [Chlamydiales bacterium]|nr:DUF721 domain-containing protein [Chlamydiales bacterium]